MTDQARDTFRPIPDPGAEVGRLARLRNDPPGRVWGVKHNGGEVTVHVNGHLFESRRQAALERQKYDAGGADCEWCDGKLPPRHTLVYRDTPMWRDE